MSEIKRKKVGFRERFLAALGKHIMFWRAKKVSKLLLHLSHREIIRELTEIYEGNLENALEKLFNMASRAGTDYLMEWIEKAAPIFSKHVGDHALWIKSGYFSFVGDHIKYIEYIPPEKEGEPHRVVWQIERCLLCTGMKEDETFPTKKEEFGEWGWGAGMAGIFQTTTNLINEYCGIQYETRCRETKCLLKGDPYGEFVIEFRPKES